MAKQFAGFTPEQMGKIIPEMQGMQADEQAKFLAAQPGAAARVGKMAELAQKRIGMASGGYVNKQGYAPGGYVSQRGENWYVKKGVGNYSQPYGSEAEANAARDGTTFTTPTPPVPTLPTPPVTTTPPVTPPVTPAPNTTGGFDMSQPDTGNNDGRDQYGMPIIDMPDLTPKSDFYDPSTGLPSVPEGVSEEDYAPFLEQVASEWDNKSAEAWFPGLTKMMSSGDVPEDPTDYEVTGRKNDWTITYADGTTIKSTYRDLDTLENELTNIANVVGEYKKSDAYTANTAAQEQYKTDLDQYKTYSADKATTSAEAPAFENVEAAQKQVTTSKNLISTYMNQLAGMSADDPQRATLEGFIDDEKIKLNQAEAGLKQATERATAERNQKRNEATSEFEDDPAGQVTRAEVATMSDAQKEAGMIAEGTGQAGTAATAATVAAAKAGDVAEPERKEAAKYTAEETAKRVQSTLDSLVATTGKPQDEALIEAQTMAPEQLAQLGLTTAQIEEAVQVKAPDRLTVQDEELISGSSVDFERAKVETNFTAATGVPSSEATVQGQLTGLLEQFEGGETPAWAAGAMRAATATLAARGLGASSMAGQAVVQAAMESAMPIAMADAQTRASFEAQNLSNRQQAAMFAAEQRSKFLGMEFDQEFQTRVQNASRIADVANQNFTAEVQIAMENSRLANTVDIANLNAKNAKLLSDAAAMTQTQLTNLNNRQQAAVDNAKSFLQFDLKEFDAKQQVAMFKTQGVIQSILTDSAAVNAAEQFNATSENQTNQFYDSLISQVQQFNVDQTNAMERFNADQANSIAQFNAGEANRREEFNATNALVIEQANAKWAQDIGLTETAAINEANRDAAKAENEMTISAYEAQIQLERDQASFGFQTANNNADRATEVAIQVMKIEASADATAAAKAASFASAAGNIIAAVLD